ncbi:MAG: SgcJ/EcaC family oxidoreductase [Steroidobacteraceae bacterium]
MSTLRAKLIMSPRTSMGLVRLMTTAAVFLLTCGRGAAAGSNATPTGRAMEPVIANVLIAWNHADARAIAAQNEAKGDFVSPDGMHAAGRQEIEAFYEGAFARGYLGSRATASVAHVRRLSGTVTLVDGAWTVEPTAASKVRQPEAGLFFAVLHRHGQRWWIAALGEQSSASTLRELDAL